MWYAPLGFCISFIGGWIISVMLTAIGWGGEQTIYTDDQKTIFNTDLFSPPIARKLRAQNAVVLERNFAVYFSQRFHISDFKYNRIGYFYSFTD